MMKKILFISVFVQILGVKMEIEITCFEKDTRPVNVEAAFEDHCQDKEGNLYNEEAKLYSCCKCIM